MRERFGLHRRPDGYCILEDTGQSLNVFCMYACAKDADCESGEVCSCESGYVSAVNQKPLAFGVCKPATCTTNSDCGTGLLCISPVQAACGHAVPGAYNCQTPEDECGGPADCPPAKSECNYRNSHYVCEAAPICGRPFLVDGAQRQSGVAEEAAWLDVAVAEAPFSELPRSARAGIAEHWTRAGLMEHASVAAFARFALQLLSLGAPPDLVEGATRAIADETRHAKLCFGLATRYAGHPVGPGPLDVTNALGAVELLDVVALVIEEGCIGETGAALEAAWAADAATDPVVREVLAGIAEDEGRHAALAWQFVAWAKSRDVRVAALVEERLRDALERSGESERELVHENAQLAAHGVLDEGSRRAARRTALRDVLPSLVTRLAA